MTSTCQHKDQYCETSTDQNSIGEVVKLGLISQIDSVVSRDDLNTVSYL